MKKIFFDYNLDHILLALLTQVICAAALFALFVFFGPLVAALAGGAMVGAMRFYSREHAQFENLLENSTSYNPHDVFARAWWSAWNPFIWPQRWDFFAPLIAVIAATIGGARFL